MKLELDMATISARLAEFEARADREGLSDLRRDLEMRIVAWGPNVHTDFMVRYGRDYQTGPNSFTLPRMQAKNCYGNATNLAIDMPHLTYVEGKMAIHGIPIDHAWCADEDGIVVDPTVRDPEAIAGYYGVAFETDYLRKATLINRVYGLLDIFSAPHTLPKLLELGLHEGQRWLLDNDHTDLIRRSRSRRKKV